MGHFVFPPERAGADGAGRGLIARPNVLWLMGDQHRHHATGYAGDPNLHTPNIDQLAHTGLYCRRGAVSGNALCCPFRGSLLTSVYPQRCIPVHEAPLPEGMRTIAHPFNDAGYHTAWFGKWHVDGGVEADGRAAFWIVPPDRRGGFQAWVGYENNNSQWDCWVHGGEGEHAFQRRLPGFETDALTDLLVAYLEERTRTEPARPFFAALSVQPPHWPTQCPPGFRRLRPDEAVPRANVPPGSSAEARFRDAAPGYYGLVENWDWNIGRVMEALRRLDLAHRTHVVVFADHGDMLGSHGHDGKVVPYEESIRTPFILGGDSFFYHGLRRGPTDAPINHVDIAPTTLGLAGIDAPDWMEGTDYSYERDPARPAPPAVPGCAYIQAISPREESPAYRGIVTRDGWKYACTANSPWILFDLEDDPYEMRNLALSGAATERRRVMHELLREKIAEVGDDFVLPPVD